jgi:hypothetical protein
VPFAHFLVVFVSTPHPRDAADNRALDGVVASYVARNGACRAIFEAAAGLGFSRSSARDYDAQKEGDSDSHRKLQSKVGNGSF